MHGLKKVGFSLVLAGVSIAFAVGAAGCSKAKKGDRVRFVDESTNPRAVSEGHAASACGPTKNITILATNDIHGAIEPKTLNLGGAPKSVGGMPFWAGAIQAVKEGLAAKTPAECGGVLVVDGGDQFQGTLLSNANEGELMFRLFNEAGYDAVVPGNHDYDFGPMGWLDDKVSPSNPDKDPRSVIKKLAAMAKFSVLSANAYYKDSLVDLNGKSIPIDRIEAKGCQTNPIVDWSRARRLEFFQPYVVKTVAGVRVALVGLDNPETATITTPENVQDLCFRDPVSEYLELRKELEAKADVFVIVVHDGDSSSDSNLSKMVKAILAARPDAVDAVVGGHTHTVNELSFDGVPAIQSGANLERFGRIELRVDPATNKAIHAKTTFVAGALLDRAGCDKKIQGFCAYDSAAKTLAYEGAAIREDADAVAMVDSAVAQLAPMANRQLGVADKALKRDRIDESPLANMLADSVREATGAEMGFVNTGGIRTDIPAGDVTYDKLYQVIPFSNHAVTIGPVPTEVIVNLMARSIQSCGGFGGLMPSGIRVTFRRDCSKPQDGIDPDAKLLTIDLLDGTRIYNNQGQFPEVLQRNFRVATLDFLAAGGSGYEAMKSVPVQRDFGIFREVMTDALLKTPRHWDGKTDGRYRNTFSAPAAQPSAAPSASK